MPALTVRQLIAKLKKCDQSALVVFQAHDQREDEYDGYVAHVAGGSERLVESEASFLDQASAKGIVVLRP